MTTGCTSIPAKPYPYELEAGESIRVSCDANTGPVEIVNTGAGDIVAAERVIYEANGINTSFTEVMALPAGQLDTNFWMPWYNNVGLFSELRVGVP